MDMVFQKLEEANLKVLPYFAAVDAQDALYEPDDADDEEEREQIITAKEGMKNFMSSLHQLGSQIATPLHSHRMLHQLLGGTQRLVNVVLRDCEDARVLSTQSILHMKEVGESMKTKFRNNVENYFTGIDWTISGVAAFTPPRPFNRDDCAINLIPSIYRESFESYKQTVAQRGYVDDSKKKAVLIIVNRALSEIQQKLLKNMRRFEQDALKELEDQFRARVGENKDLLVSKVGLTVYDHFVATGTFIGGIGGGLLVYTGCVSHGLAAAAAGGTGIMATAGAAVGVLLGSFVLLPMLFAGGAYLARNEIGWWKVDEIKDVALTECLGVLERNQTELINTLADNFNKHVDMVVNGIEQFRLPTDARQDTQMAADIMARVKSEMLNSQQALQGVLNENPQFRWLEGNPELQKVWLEGLARSNLGQRAQEQAAPSSG